MIIHDYECAKRQIKQITAMTNHEITGKEYCIYVSGALTNAIFFMYILIQNGYLFQSNKYAIIVLLCIIVYGLEPFWMTDMIILFDLTCYDGSDECNGCNGRGYVYSNLIRIMALMMSMLLMLIRILEMNFQPFGFLAYRKGFIITLKIFAIIMSISPILLHTLGLMEFAQFGVTTVKGDESKHVCKVLPANHARNRIIRSIFGLCYLSFLILLWILFIKRAIRLYQVQKVKSSKSDKVEMLKNVKLVAYGIVKPILRQSISVSIFIIASMLSIVSGSIPVLHPFTVFLMGLSIILMFSQKKDWFRWFCGSSERKLIKKWIQLQFDSLETMNECNDDVQDYNHININVIPMNAAPDHNNSTHKALEPIVEDETTLTVPEWNLWHYDLEQNELMEQEIELGKTIDPDILNAVLALRFGAPTSLSTTSMHFRFSN